jgi:hypothetical protein
MNKTNNPYLGHVWRLTTYKNAMLGVDYGNAVNAQLERVVGADAPQYEVEKAKGMHRYDDFFMQSDKDENQLYLTIIEYKGTSTHESIMLLDGQPCTAEQENSISVFIPNRKEGCKKQEDAGLSREQQRKINRPKTQNVLYIKQGERVIYQK